MSSTLRDVLIECWTEGTTIKSNFSREHAAAIAEAACRGYITILSADQKRTMSKWLVTPLGLKELFDSEAA